MRSSSPPRRRGRLRLPGEYSQSHRPPAHGVRFRATNEDRTHADGQQIGTAERYHVVYDVTNTNDSPAFARIELSVAEDPPP